MPHSLPLILWLLLALLLLGLGEWWYIHARHSVRLRAREDQQRLLVDLLRQQETYQGLIKRLEEQKKSAEAARAQQEELIKAWVTVMQDDLRNLQRRLPPPSAK